MESNVYATLLFIPSQCSRIRFYFGHTRGAHFNSRVHDFWRCAPGVCTFFEPFIIAIYWEGDGAISGCTVLWEVHPASAQNKSLISDTAEISKIVHPAICPCALPYIKVLRC